MDSEFIALIFFAVILTVLLFYLIQLFRYAGKIRIIGEGRKPVSFLKGKEQSLYYIPNLRYGWNPKLNTMAAFTRNKIPKKPEREFLQGADGGTFALDWFTPLEDSKKQSAIPIIVFVHGITGGSHECYLKKCALRLAKEFGVRCCCLINRGCCGTTLTSQRTYNAGYTEDLHLVVKELIRRNPDAPIALVGYSLGGNIVAKYLGEQNSAHEPYRKYKQVAEKDPVPSNVKCAVVICNPNDIYGCNVKITLKENMFYGKGLMKYAIKHQEELKELPSFQELMRKQKENPSDTRLWLFDEHITCPLFGYDTWQQFYKDASSYQYVDGVQIPLLYLVNRNDPSSIYSCFEPDALNAIQANKNLAAIIFPGGGHLGAFYPFTTRKAMDEDFIVAYLRSQLPKPKKTQ